MYICRECGAKSPKWAGKCPNCQAWNTLEELNESVKSPARITPGKILTPEKVTSSEVNVQHLERLESVSGELDSVLGG
jgi:DNA repair protein RadA/Sms